MIVRTVRLSVLLTETSSLTSSEFASVLATSGTTSAEGESMETVGNSLTLRMPSVHNGVTMRWQL